MSSTIEPPVDDEVIRVKAATDRLLDTPGVGDLVAAYFDPDGRFAADTFDALEPRDDCRLTVTDLLAVTFLNVTVKPRVARLILRRDARELERQLGLLCPDVPLWEADDATLKSACELFEWLDAYDEVGPVIASKVLARKRPALIPIVDRVVAEVLCLPVGRAWITLRVVLQDPHLRATIDGLRRTPDDQTTTIRLLDVAAWMRGSRSRNAKAARAALGVPELS